MRDSNLNVPCVTEERKSSASRRWENNDRSFTVLISYKILVRHNVLVAWGLLNFAAAAFVAFTSTTQNRQNLITEEFILISMLQEIVFQRKSTSQRIQSTKYNEQQKAKESTKNGTLWFISMFFFYFFLNEN